MNPANWPVANPIRFVPASVVHDWLFKCDAPLKDRMTLKAAVPQMTNERKAELLDILVAEM